MLVACTARESLLRRETRSNQANTNKHPFCQIVGFQLRLRSDLAKIVSRECDDCADCPIAVVATFVDRWGQIYQPPQEFEGFGGPARRYMRHDRRPLHPKILRQRFDLAPIQKRARLGNRCEPFADFRRNASAPSSTDQFKTQASFRRCVTCRQFEQQLSKSLGPQQCKILGVEGRFGSHAPYLQGVSERSSWAILR